MEPLFQADHAFQIERKEKLSTAVSFSVGLAVICCSIINFGIEKARFANGGDWWKAVPFVASAACVILFAYHCKRFFFGNEYAHLPFSRDLKGLQNQWKASHGHLSNEAATAGFYDQVEGLYIEGATHNASVNDRRSSALYWMNAFVFAGILLALSGSALVVIENKLAQKVDRNGNPAATSPAASPAATSPAANANDKRARQQSSKEVVIGR